MDLACLLGVASDFQSVKPEKVIFIAFYSLLLLWIVKYLLFLWNVFTGNGKPLWLIEEVQEYYVLAV